MQITLDLPMSLAQEFRRNAALKGVSLESYVLQILSKTKKKPSRQGSETELLKKIHLNITEDEWESYRHLIQLRRDDQLSNQEWKELVRLGEKIEEANAERLKYVAALAKLRGVSFLDLFHELGIHPVEV